MCVENTIIENASARFALRDDAIFAPCFSDDQEQEQDSRIYCCSLHFCFFCARTLSLTPHFSPKIGCEYFNLVNNENPALYLKHCTNPFTVHDFFCVSQTQPLRFFTNQRCRRSQPESFLVWGILSKASSSVRWRFWSSS
jgi:hypothetical protein